VIGSWGVNRISGRTGRQASVRGRRVAAAAWRTQTRGLDLSTVLAHGGNEDEDEITLGLAVLGPLTRRSGTAVSDGGIMSGGSGTDERGVEVGAIEPHAMHDDGEASGERDGGLARADLLGQRSCPALEYRGGLDAVEQCHSGLEEQAADHGVAAFADRLDQLGLAGLVASGGQTEVRPDIRGMAEARGIVDAGLVGESVDGADAGDGHELPAHG